MALKTTHDTLEEIPEAQQELYSEQNGKYVLTGISGVKTQEDITRLQSALNKERDDHKATKTGAGVWGDLDHAEVIKKLDRYDELEASAGKSIPEEKLEEMAELRARTRLAPIERENKTLKELNVGLTEQNATYNQKEIRRSIHDTVRKALVESKVVASAHEDALMLAERVFEITEDGKILTRDGVGTTPGMDPALWLAEIQEKRAHWWPASVGGGARGSGDTQSFPNNPFSAAHWNLTEQSKMVATLGEEKAERMAAAAGVKIGATHPAAKAS